MIRNNAPSNSPQDVSTNDRSSFGIKIAVGDEPVLVSVSDAAELRADVGANRYLLDSVHSTSGEPSEGGASRRTAPRLWELSSAAPQPYDLSEDEMHNVVRVYFSADHRDTNKTGSQVRTAGATSHHTSTGAGRHSILDSLFDEGLVRHPVTVDGRTNRNRNRNTWSTVKPVPKPATLTCIEVKGGKVQSHIVDEQERWHLPECSTAFCPGSSNAQEARDEATTGLQCRTDLDYPFNPRLHSSCIPAALKGACSAYPYTSCADSEPLGLGISGIKRRETASTGAGSTIADSAISGCSSKSTSKDKQRHSGFLSKWSITSPRMLSRSSTGSAERNPTRAGNRSSTFPLLEPLRKVKVPVLYMTFSRHSAQREEDCDYYVPDRRPDPSNIPPNLRESAEPSSRDRFYASQQESYPELSQGTTAPVHGQSGYRTLITAPGMTYDPRATEESGDWF